MKIEFGDFDKQKLVENYKNAMQDENFKKLVKRFDLSDDDLMKYTGNLEDVVVELKHCKNCKSLHECKNKIPGFVYYPTKIGNHLKFDYVACKYKNNQIKNEVYSCNYYEIPSNLKLASMKNIELDDAKRVKAIKWLKNFYDTYLENKNQKGLYLHGSFGSGKTYLVCAMLNELAKKKIDITIVYYPELLRSLKESFKMDDFGDRINKLKKVSILFLDDIGAESVTEWGRDEILGTILQYRMESSLPTFFTSNLTIDELEVHLSNTKNSVEKVKARRITERIKQLTDQIEIISKNRRN